MVQFTSALLALVAVGGVSNWITEPFTWWPILGSAATYMGYLSGNVYSIRVPVAVATQKRMKADITTPRGQIVTIVGVGASIVVNLVFLAIIVFGGGSLLNILPAAVVASFSFALPALMGSMMPMYCETENGYLPGLKKKLPYIVWGVVVNFILEQTPLSSFAMLIAVFSTILFGYIRFRVKHRNDNVEEA